MSKFKFQLGLLSLNNMIMHITANCNDKIQWYHELAIRLRILKMYQNFFIDCSFIKIIAVQFGAI